MKLIAILLLVLSTTLGVPAQKPDEILATAKDHVFRLRDLSAKTQKLVADAGAEYTKTRSNLYDQFIAMRLLQAEAASRRTTTGQVIIADRTKIKDPTEAAIKKIYDENQAQLAGHPLNEVRPQIVAYLRSEPEQKSLTALIIQLRSKFKFIPGKDINASRLLLTDVIGTVNGKPLTEKEFEDFAQFDLFEARDKVATAVLDDVYEKIQAAIGEVEAKALGIDTSTLIAREITNKMKDFTDQERERLARDFYDRLNAKYLVKILYKGPAQPVESISADVGPSTGPVGAPVTIVMFSDFQCSHCAATHPLLNEAMAAFPGKIRFVVRDFPLETVHDHAYRAALAGYAAHQQGKFFEYLEILYKNQTALDDASLLKYASQIGLNAKQFELDFKSEKAAAEVKKDITDGEDHGVQSTPTIFINGLRARVYSVDGFRDAIERALKK